jgi:hypothetical protein
VSGVMDQDKLADLRLGNQCVELHNELASFLIFGKSERIQDWP